MKKSIFIIAVWLVSIYVLKHNHLLPSDMDELKEFISRHTEYAMLLFVALWCLRLLVFIPGATLMIFGGVYFEPLLGFLLSMAGIILSETLVYLFSKTVIGTKLSRLLEKKRPELGALLETQNYKFLALGIICPIAPTDAICFLSASLGAKYMRYMLTIIVSNLPLLLLYSLIGTSISESLIGMTAGVVLLGGVTVVSINIWNNLKNAVNFSNRAKTQRTKTANN
ncbi:TVP38/TMEM64 family protein [Bacillus sp. PK3_68]|nr:TVP38/TMEM64 family protein [Bacillus sp. PK3_68]